MPFLEACAAGHDVACAVTRPDKPAGRRLELRSPAVKEAAGRLGIPVLQPERPAELAGVLASFGADAGVVVAYGGLLKPEVLAAARLGFLNVHFSLLPKYRGAAPIAWALCNGDPTTGVTLFWLDEGMDTGPIQARREVEVGPDEDASELTRRLTRLGVSALADELVGIERGLVRREPQRGEPSLAPKLVRADSKMDFALPAEVLHNRVRGLRAGPRAYFAVRRSNRLETVSLLKTTVGGREPLPDRRPVGTILGIERGRGVLVQCLPGRLWLMEVQPEGKRQIPAVDFVNGLRLRPGDRLTPHG